jgi:hypothetical protein
MERRTATRRQRLLMNRLVIVVVVVLAAAVFASPAAAEKPVKFDMPETIIGVDTDLCPFPVTVVEHMDGSVIGWADDSGGWIRGHDHIAEQDTFMANGKTLVSLPYTENFHPYWDSSGNMTHGYRAGVVEKIRLPDGTMLINAGWNDWIYHTGDVFVLYPDKGYSDPADAAKFCAALAP